MAEKKSTKHKILAAESVDWKLQKQHRLAVLWHVAAMSLNVAPTVPAVKAASRNLEFKKNFAARKKLLGLKMIEEPADGYVTYFPNHPYNKSLAGTRNRMVDVVSCISVLEQAYPGALAEDFVELKTQLARLPLPGARLIVASNAIPSGKPKKDQTNRTATLVEKNVHILLYLIAHGGYKYSADNKPAQNESAINEIMKDIPERYRGVYGLGRAAVANRLLEASTYLVKDEE